MRQLPGFTPAMTVHESKELNMIIRNAYLDRWKTRVTQWLARYSIAMLRISLSLVLLVFGALEFIPGLGPVEDLVADTMGALTLGLITGRVALLLVATVETVIGLLLVTGRYLRLGLALLGLAMVGILSPLVLFPDRLFAVPGIAPLSRASTSSRTWCRSPRSSSSRLARHAGASSPSEMRQRRATTMRSRRKRTACVSSRPCSARPDNPFAP
jgi:putative oxidoreductase